MQTYYPVISIAGSDSSGGAGIQADIKTISAIGCYAMTAITTITVQNTTGVTDIQSIRPDIVAGQIEAVCTDIPPYAAKTGMLFNADIITAVADTLKRFDVPNIVVDPVMVSTSGSLLMERDAINAMIEKMFPLAAIVTPNFNEAREITGESDPEKQIARFFEMGCRNVLIKGGDNKEMPDVKIDILASNDNCAIRTELKADAVNTENTHGTGCTLSSAIASYLALGYTLDESVCRAKHYITRALRAGANVRTGHGHGPVNHFFNPRHLKTFNPNKKWK